MTILDEIQHEVWHILTVMYTHGEMLKDLPSCRTRYDMGNQFVALNALSEMLVLRIARLADKDKKLRTVSMFLKRGNFAAPDEDVKNAADKFITQAGPVVKMRHEQIAHMKLGTLSSYEPKSIEASVISAVIALVEFVNVARQQTVSYRYRVGSQEAEVDLLASLEAGSRVTVK